MDENHINPNDASEKPPKVSLNPIALKALQDLIRSTGFAQLFRSRLIFSDIKRLPPLFPEPPIYYPLPVNISENVKTFELLKLPPGCVGAPSKTVLHMGNDFKGWDIALPIDQEIFDLDLFCSNYADHIHDYVKTLDNNSKKELEYCYIRGFETPNDSVFEFFTDEQVAKLLEDLSIQEPKKTDGHDKNAQ
ncbi:uncharacterized protein LOC119687651 [Teleopsis dalmanni]|uniref:uncharacterized protein LOC119687651 n=1 Tax=Teleopsis dalmanni TaxID=139649 RepID=UPI0018CE4BDD|nr:uncharacterized protein LOC119687651 [Teleopsis dalmanni]XP_037957985.1 uncharacterized protein LOC119687651 [Teleopsis dalmanni]